MKRECFLLCALLAVAHGQINKGTKKCMEDLGCFVIEADWYHPIYRPVNVLPADRESINVRYRIYSQTSGVNYQLVPALDIARYNISKLDIDPKLETKIITHGWMDNQLFGEWMRDLKDLYMHKGDYNVVIVDWSGGNSPPYIQAVANTRVVGAEIAFLINTLKAKMGLDPGRVHVMGHSLGGQIVGYAGEKTPGLGKITSFDPAEPLYQNMPPHVRIDPTDAQFVEVIHTDSKSILQLGLAMNQLAGHVDFFPNNGFEQPGCKLDRIISIFTDGLLEGIRRMSVCDHQRAIDYFMESVNSRCQMVAYACPDYESFLEGRCGDCGAKGERCAMLGDRSHLYAPNKNDSRPVKMYLKTNSGKPYCLYHYQIQVRLQRGNWKDQRGVLYMRLKGRQGEEEFMLSKTNENLYHGSQYTYLATTPKELGSIQAVTFRWKTSGLSKSAIYLDEIKINPMNEVDPKARESETRFVCAKSTRAVDSGKDILFTKFGRC